MQRLRRVRAFLMAASAAVAAVHAHAAAQLAASGAALERRLQVLALGALHVGGRHAGGVSGLHACSFSQLARQ